MRSVFLFFAGSAKRAVIFAVVWTLIIFLACLIPGRDVPSVGFPGIDKWVHFVIFGGFSFLWLATLKRGSVGKCVIAFLAAVAVGYMVELLQGSGITSGRAYDLWDVVADGIGGALGALLFYIMDRAYRHKKTA